MQSIEQKKEKELRKYTLDPGVLKAEIKHEGVFTAFDIKYEDIGFEEIIKSKRPEGYEVAFLVSLLFNLVMGCLLLNQLFPGLISPDVASGGAMGSVGILGIWFAKAFQFKMEKVLIGEQNIFFYYGKKEKDKVDRFIEKLRSKQKEFIRGKYMKIDTLIPLERQEENFQWLYQKEFISRSELVTLLEELDNLRIMYGNRN